MLKLATTIMRGSRARTALLCTIQNTAGQVYRQPQARLTPQASLPGDGCGVAYLVAGAGSPILAVQVRNDPASASDMRVALDHRRYWEVGTSEFNVSFNADSFQEILDRGNTLVPRLVREVCATIGIQPTEITALITNQPNRQFLRRWDQELGLDPARHVDTFDRFGNLYGAGVTVTLDHAVREHRVRDGDLVMLAGFAHAGDLAAAAAVRWHDPS
jgi:3-oxoacyl-[acyl-carrier-protein] synthase-3